MSGFSFILFYICEVYMERLEAFEKMLADIIKQADENMYIEKKKYHESLNSR